MLIKENAMLALVITALFTLTGLIAVLVIADSLLKARAAHARLMREASLMEDCVAVQPAVRTQSAPRRITADRRVAPLQMSPLRACAAA